MTKQDELQSKISQLEQKIEILLTALTQSPDFPRMQTALLDKMGEKAIQTLSTAIHQDPLNQGTPLTLAKDQAFMLLFSRKSMADWLNAYEKHAIKKTMSETERASRKTQMESYLLNPDKAKRLEAIRKFVGFFDELWQSEYNLVVGDPHKDAVSFTIPWPELVGVFNKIIAIEGDNYEEIAAILSLYNRFPKIFDKKNALTRPYISTPKMNLLDKCTIDIVVKEFTPFRYR